MDDALLTWVAGSILLAAAAVTALIAARTLSHGPSRHHPVTGLLWLLLTAALAVVGAAFWAEPGMDLGNTWPFGVAVLVALSPLPAAAAWRRRRRTTPDPADHG